MSARGGRKSANPLDKKIKENPKYSHVRSGIDTGASVSKYMEKMEEMKRDYNFKHNEIFKRMKFPTFVQLVVQVSDVDVMSDIQEEGDSVYDHAPLSERPDTADNEVSRVTQKRQPDTGRQSPPEIDTSRSRLQQVITGMGEVDLDTPKVAKAPPSLMGENSPYLLLDVRDKDDYDECHIITAKSYPTAMLARSVNYESKEMLKYKNKSGKIILIYDDDEKISHRASTTLVERGYDNIFMLSGGLRVAYKLFPEGLITGTISNTILEDLGIKKPKEPREKIPADMPFFTELHIDKLIDHLDSALTDRSSGSRLSKASSRTGRSSSISSTSTMSSSYGRKPFK